MPRLSSSSRILMAEQPNRSGEWNPQNEGKAMRFPGQIEIWSGGHRDELRVEPAENMGSREDDRSLAAAMREIAWSLAGWLGVSSPCNSCSTPFMLFECDSSIEPVRE